MGSITTVSTLADSRRPVDADTFLRGLLDGMRCGVVAVDPEGRLVLCNEVACRVLGLSQVPRIGEPLDRILPEEQRAIARVLNDAFDMETLPNRAEIPIARPDGTTKTIGFTLSLVHDASGRAPVGCAMFFKDLTQIEECEEQDRLKDRLAALGQMAASMAHEIRNPLAGIDVTCALLRRRLGPQSDGLELLNKISSEVKRLNGTISSSLEFVRPIALEFRPTNLTTLLNEAASVARRRVGERGHLKVSVQRNFPICLADRERLRQVFENLILNALEAIDTEGSVRVTLEQVRRERSTDLVPYEPSDEPNDGESSDAWREADSLACICVEDDGPGIPPDRRDRVFHPFYTTKQGGSGVGLATAKKIVDGHRGWIDVTESADGGAAFHVRFPIVRGEAEV